jgi:hypothetical protein
MHKLHYIQAEFGRCLSVCLLLVVLHLRICVTDIDEMWF